MSVVSDTLYQTYKPSWISGDFAFGFRIYLSLKGLLATCSNHSPISPLSPVLLNNYIDTYFYRTLTKNTSSVTDLGEVPPWGLTVDKKDKCSLR